MRIFKYTLAWLPEQTITLPANFAPLVLFVQRGEPTLWAKVDEAVPSKAHKVRMYPTGAELPRSAGQYIGTLQMANLVFHFFVEVEHGYQ